MSATHSATQAPPNARPLVNWREELAKKTATANLKDRIGNVAGNAITTKGKLFTTPDGKSNPGPMRIIVLDFISINTYYDGPYNPNQLKPPVCWAIGPTIDALAPSPKAPQRQHETCLTCPKNEWGSDGGKGKACKNGYRLAVCAPDANESTMIMTLGVNKKALSIWNTYVSNLQARFGAQATPAFFITEVSFNPNMTYPSLMFNFVSEHDNPHVAYLYDLAQPILEREPSA